MQRLHRKVTPHEHTRTHPAPRHCHLAGQRSRPGRSARRPRPPRPGRRDIRILLAYARELATPRPYRLADLADATGKSLSGVRTAYTGHDVSIARRIIQDISRAHDAAQRPKDGGHDLHHPLC